MLNLAVVNYYLKEFSFKRRMFNFNNIGSIKIVFTFLAKVIAFYIRFFIV